MPEHPVAPDELLLRIFRDEADAETARQEARRRPALPAPATKRIRDLKAGDHFLHGGFEGWIVQTSDRYVRARRVGTFDEDRIYFDALTAAKAGEFSWDSEVQEYQPPPGESPFLLLARAIRLLAPQITRNGALDARALGVARDLEKEYRRVR